ncbi:nucleotidyltransferase domain-containing protein [Candidatus Shapirobacteria bacterium]|nr:nucleotidyltransferase domain-containing protein [Candidatus Shapirobacteria bacterium]
MNLTKMQIDQIKNFLKKQKGIIAVYLYGSFAVGKAKKNSDLDLAILYKKKSKLDQNLFAQIKLANQLSKLLKKKVETQSLDAVSLPFAFRVISQGKLLLGKESYQRVDFELKISRNYFDLKNFYQEYELQIANLARKGVIDARPFAY